MAYINRKYATLLDLKLSNKDYYDIQVSEYDAICNCNDIVEPIICMNFNSLGTVYVDNEWVGAISASGVTIPNFGITGYDNRFSDSIDSDWGLDGEKRFFVKQVDGENFCYDVLSGSTVQLCGGFYQGFYKLEGYEYQTLPEHFVDGWTAEFYLAKSGCTCDSELPTLNETYPNNEGIFYYYGTRAENKFCSLKEHILSYEVSSGVTFLNSIIEETSHIKPPSDTSPFLFFNCPSLSDFYLNATGVTFTLPDCCDNLKYNALAFRITDEGKIGYRYLATSGTCVDGKFEEDLLIFEKYSTENIFTDENYHLVTIKFQSDNPHICKPKEQSFGTLSIYVDGFLKLREYNFPNIVPEPFDDLPSKQLGVPYNISIGGGTQGLLEMPTDVPTEYEVCDYQFYLKKNQFFKGVRINGVDYFTVTDFDFTQKDEIISFYSSLLDDRFISIQTKETSHYVEFTNRFVLDDFEKVYYSVDIDEDITGGCCNPNLPDYSQNSLHKTNCFKFVTDNNICGVLEENFAGTFIGKIKSFCLYDVPLDYQVIKCNYDIYNS